ncbi:AbgT family transporter [Streptomyces hainanensis]|uniref:AbgT family transporter n=1 Tax=Streptomyces hainanensis TaxID=402648 RepID=A0A4R4T7D1_9ACTN|nr:AbgT family transporter [Streptomyces hainanensis]TDC73051.1 AbgT family transporter [Streptomyces hainanensis]
MISTSESASETAPESAPESASETTRDTTRLTRFLDRVERVGNRLPHPFLLFWLLFCVVAVASAIMAAADVSALDPATGEPSAVRNALSVDAVRELMLGAEESFLTFGPLGTMLIIMFGLAVADRSGMLEALARHALGRVHPRYAVFTVCLAGALSKFLSYSAYVILIPLAALVFKAVGRSPMLGMIVGFLSINAAGDANPFIAPGDVVFARIATEAAQLVDPDTVVRATDNTYFTTVSALLLAIVLTLVTEKVLARREHELVPDSGATGPTTGPTAESGSEAVPEETELRALRRTGVVAAAFLGLLVVGMIPAGSPLRGPNGAILDSTLFNGIALALSLFFLVIGAVYAHGTGRLTNSSDLPRFMADGVRSIAPLLVLFFAVSQFLALFEWTSISTVVAVRGAEVLEGLNAPIFVVLMLLIAAIAVLNLLITSGTALWALLAPVIIPMTMLIGANPATVMAVYRIADSCTNSITPMSATFVLTVGYLQTYQKKAGIGTLVSFTLPAAVAMMAAWTALFAAWYALGLPLGPGAPVH